MRLAILLNCLLVLSLFLLLDGERRPGSPVPLQSFALSEIHGRYGGPALWVAEDRTAFVQIVGRAPGDSIELREKRYRKKLSAEQWSDVERIVGANHFLSLNPRARTGLPGESGSVIRVLTQAGSAAEILKWDRDQNADFNAVRNSLVTLLNLTRAEGELIYEGPFNWEWRPDHSPTLRE
jgi:hypothetical protein